MTAKQNDSEKPLEFNERRTTTFLPDVMKNGIGFFEKKKKGW